MTQEDEEFLQRLLATFKVEADEHLGAMSSLLLQLERGASSAESGLSVEALFREAHSLKGAARSVNLADVERVCQALERVMAAWKRAELTPSPALFDTLHQTLDGLGRLLGGQAQGDTRPDAGMPAQLSRSLLTLLAPAPATHPAQDPPPAAAEPVPPPLTAPAATADTVRVATARLEALLTQAEELQTQKFSSAHLADELAATSEALAAWRRQWDKRLRQARALRRAGIADAMPHPRHRRVLVQMLDSVDADELSLKALSDGLARLQSLAARERRTLSSRVDRLLDDMKQVLMLPLSSLLTPLPRLVRDLAHDSGKDVELIVRGGALDVDRRILEQMRTPLIHLLRNAVDHGIETPARRQHAGKSARGRITIDVAPREGNRVEIAIVDDGIGIDLGKVRSRAQAMRLLPPSALEAMSPSQLADLVFESGLSTSPLLTDLSGHGLGLAIVREKVEALGGSIAVDLPAGGAGTSFCIVLPVTLATFRGLLVHAGDAAFVLPSRNVERVCRVPLAAIPRGDGGRRITLDGDELPLVSLAAVLGLPPVRRNPALRFQQVVLLASGDKRIAFAVDEVVGDEEVLVKPLASPLKRVRHIAGATVLGAGRVVPLLNVVDLMKTAQLQRADDQAIAGDAEAAASLLVAEDSITSRALLKGILESAGFRVTTAADGIEALEQLHRHDFDLLVTDVEMPRLDGFGLTARLRADKRLAELPVILVTALDTREDKERGVDVGANAYIVKSGFDQRKLLAAIRTLL